MSILGNALALTSILTDKILGLFNRVQATIGLTKLAPQSASKPEMLSSPIKARLMVF